MAAGNSAALFMHGCSLCASVAAGDYAVLFMQGCSLGASVAVMDYVALFMQGLLSNMCFKYVEIACAYINKTPAIMLPQTAHLNTL